jgi:hypothetical protein
MDWPFTATYVLAITAGRLTMKRSMTLTTELGDNVRLSLENWGSGVDQQFHRWVLEDLHGSKWRCIETGKLAHPSTLFSLSARMLGRRKSN